MTRVALALALAAAVAACGGKSAPKTSTVVHSDEMHAQHDGLPPEVAAFHDRLAPLYHAEPGKARTEETCAAVPDFNALVDNLGRAPAPPTVDATAWGEHVGTLRGSVGELAADCGNGAAGFDAKFETLHDSFHALIEMLPEAEEHH